MHGVLNHAIVSAPNGSKVNLHARELADIDSSTQLIIRQSANWILIVS